MTNDNADDGDGTASSSSSPWQPWPSEALAMAQCALDLTRQDWTLTGHTMPTTTTTTTNTNGSDSTNGSNTGVEEIAERIVSLLLIRIVALVTCRLGNIPAPSPVDNNGAELDGGDNESVNTINTSNHSADSIKGSSTNNNNKHHPKHHPKLYPDYSTTTICTIALPSAPPPRRQFPSAITPAVIAQLRRYVRAICRRYRGAEEVPYHNVEHAYHVFLSANKLLDLMLCEEEEEEGSSELDSTDRMDDRANTTDNNNNNNNGDDDDNNDNYIMVAGRRRRRGRCATTESTGTTTITATTSHSKSKTKKRKRRRTFGIKSDPLSQLALLFSALVHDVDHTGISNRQLVLEMDDLAILYNDQSAAEQRSLAVAFRTLKGRGYGELREVLFPTSTSTGGLGGSDRSDDHDDHAPAAASSGGIMLGNEDFFKFRKLVIDLVLVTDIASPERTQIVKSKWKEAFGEVIVAEKLRKSMMTPNNSTCDDDGGGGSGSGGAKGGVKGG
eukprot:CAMPEP_0201658298 /NCGR_PEP_ID=MMETSP0494-20130426/1233_1 /ASSEMBLY_ACC=CAM_ASM_000839 /TAXON_ID=420259 /ORGANISM="Thalassiosira gravida, Strain GMp14c1" /LENGTH=499 /DNA_ID=CAMNT_0048135269 /DNA_START=33 /DNA_END=1528 /DNA_ORIENTATION=+